VRHLSHRASRKGTPTETTNPCEVGLTRVPANYTHLTPLAHFKAPKTVVFGPLPKTSTGKIQKFLLRERAKET